MRPRAWAARWGPVVALSAAIFWLSSRPNLGEPHVFAAFLDGLFGGYTWYVRAAPVVTALDAASSWLAHFVEFGALALAWLWALRGSKMTVRQALVLAWLFTAIYGLTDELHQHYVSGRHSDWRDVVTDAAGAAFALAAATLAYRRRRA